MSWVDFDAPDPYFNGAPYSVEWRQWIGVDDPTATDRTAYKLASFPNPTGVETKWFQKYGFWHVFVHIPNPCSWPNRAEIPNFERDVASYMRQFCYGLPR